MRGVTFHTFPRPVVGDENHPKTIQCRQWIKACGRPDHQLNMEMIIKDIIVRRNYYYRICSMVSGVTMPWTRTGQVLVRFGTGPILAHYDIFTGMTLSIQHFIVYRADSRLAPSQWETSLQSNAVSHWLGAILVSALRILYSGPDSGSAPCYRTQSASYITPHESVWLFRLFHSPLAQPLRLSLGLCKGTVTGVWETARTVQQSSGFSDDNTMAIQ